MLPNLMHVKVCAVILLILGFAESPWTSVGFGCGGEWNWILNSLKAVTEPTLSFGAKRWAIHQKEKPGFAACKGSVIAFLELLLGQPRSYVGVCCFKPFINKHEQKECWSFLVLYKIGWIYSQTLFWQWI